VVHKRQNIGAKFRLFWGLVKIPAMLWWCLSVPVASRCHPHLPG